MNDDALVAVLHRHLSAAVVTVADAFPAVSPARQAQLISVVRHLTAAELALSSPTVDPPPSDAGSESADERIERRAAEAAGRAEQMLDGLYLTDDERQFAQHVGERLVDLVTDAYRDSVLASKRLDPACISAAVAVALMIVHDPPDDRPTA